MPIDLEHRECHCDHIDRILRVLSYTIRGIITIYDDIVYGLLFWIVPYLLCEHRYRCTRQIREVFFEDICRTRDTLRLATSDESVSSHTRLSEYITRSCEHISSMIECELSGDEGSTFDRCLRDDYPIRESGYYLIANREVVRLRLGTDREYRHESSSRCDDRVEQSSILGGIVPLHSRAKHRYRIAT